ncbi:hypothetical protein [Solihabitans fulvus]|nr:hypothetical protein [Solihabitans fulvus]
MAESRIPALLALTIAVGATLAACGQGGGYGGGYGGAGGSTSTAPAGGGLASRDQVGVGTVLTDGGGRALYVNDQESTGSVKCVGACLGVIRRSDNGQQQLTYRGAPLYLFAGDDGGSAKGNNAKDSFGGVAFTWHVVTIGSAPTSQTTQDQGGGYGY